MLRCSGSFMINVPKTKGYWERCLGISIIIRAAGTVTVFVYALNGEFGYCACHYAISKDIHALTVHTLHACVHVYS